MAAQVETPAPNPVLEMSWKNTPLVPEVLPTNSLAVWRVKNPSRLDPNYLAHSASFAEVVREARDKLTEALPSTKNDLVEAIILGEHEVENIRLERGYPEGVVGFPYEGRYVYNHTGQLATTKGGFEKLPLEQQRGSVHELTHLLPGMKNLPYWMGEGFCEAVPRFLLSYHDKLQTTPYLQEKFWDEIVHPRMMDDIKKTTGKGESLFSISRRGPFGENKAYMSALAYVLGLSSHLGNGSINKGLLSFYDLVRDSKSPQQLRDEIDKVSSSFASDDRYTMMNEMQKKGVEILKAPIINKK